MNYWIGQAFGLVATVLDISLPQFKKKWQMLAVNIGTNTTLGLNLVFLGEIGSGIFLFMVAVAQAIVNLIHTLRDTQVPKFEYALFFALYVGLGFYGLFTGPNYVPGINWHNLLELLPIMGAVLNCIFVSTRDPILARKYLVCCTSIWMVYNAIIGSTAVIGSFFSVVSGVVAIIRNRKA